jgi:O-antigen/teichoic acid export membrane protein
MSQADRAILGRFVPIEELAFYNIAYALGSLPLVLMSSLSRSIFMPLYVKRPPSASHQNRNNLARARFLVLSGLILATTVLALIGIPFIEVAYDDRYASAGPLVTLIALALMPSVVLGNYEMVVLAAGHSGRYAALMLGMAMVRTGALLVGIQEYGLVGAVYAMFISSFITYIPLVLCIRSYGSWLPRQDFLFLAMGALGTALTLGLAPEARDLLALPFRGME